MLAHVDGQLCSGQERRHFSILQKKRSRRFIDRRWKSEHILRRDRLPVRQKPGFGAKRIKQALIGRRFELGERIQYITTKAVWIIATERDLNLA
jgi:hypothetical protein